MANIMSQQFAQVVAVTATSLSAAASLVAAALWFWSAKVTIPDPGQFPIAVVRPDSAMGPIGDPIGAKYVGSGVSPELQKWASAVSSAFSIQSDRSAWAAISAGLAAIFAAIGACFELMAFISKF
jgi:hypothetical protein